MCNLRIALVCSPDLSGISDEFKVEEFVIITNSKEQKLEPSWHNCANNLGCHEILLSCNYLAFLSSKDGKDDTTYELLGIQ